MLFFIYTKNKTHMQTYKIFAKNKYSLFDFHTSFNEILTKLLARKTQHFSFYLIHTWKRWKFTGHHKRKIHTVTK